MNCFYWALFQEIGKHLNFSVLRQLNTELLLDKKEKLGKQKKKLYNKKNNWAKPKLPVKYAKLILYAVQMLRPWDIQNRLRFFGWRSVNEFSRFRIADKLFLQCLFNARRTFAISRSFQSHRNTNTPRHNQKPLSPMPMPSDDLFVVEEDVACAVDSNCNTVPWVLMSYDMS